MNSPCARLPGVVKDLVREAIFAGHTAVFTTAECYTPPVVTSGDRRD
jgi:hypothetical protein